MISVRDIDHLVLRVVDPERMLAFYRDALGCVLVRRDESIGLLQMRAGRSMIDLVSVAGKLGQIGGRAPGAQGRNLDHFCLRIEPFDQAQIRLDLDRLGIPVGAAGLRFGAEGEGLSVYITDPEGNTVELKGPAADGAGVADPLGVA